MKGFIKKIISKKLLLKISKIKEVTIKQNRKANKLSKAFIFFINLFRYRIYIGESKEIEILNNSKIKLKFNDSFITSLDINKYVISSNKAIGNTTIDYSKFINTNLEKLLSNFENSNNKYDIMEKKLIKAMLSYQKRLVSKASKTVKRSDLVLYLSNALTTEKTNFYANLQKIIFLNSIAWQTGIRLNGLGRLDVILNESYNEYVNDGHTEEEIAKLIYDFLDILHTNYQFKSNLLLGDTGQIIILGGLDKENNYFCNDLTYIFINQIKKYNSPDPKILLRVSNKMPKELLRTAVECIKEGSGSPLISNDDIIIPKLMSFGYGTDSFNYVTAACWEPLIYGKSFDQNNLYSINFAIPFNNMLDNEIDFIDFDDIVKKYAIYLHKYLMLELKKIDEIVFDSNLLLSLFTDNCNINKKNISAGGAMYNNYGVTSLGMASVVNSFLNIKSLCYEKKLFSIRQLNDSRKNNFPDEKILNSLKANSKKFGLNDQNVINLTSMIVDLANVSIENYSNRYGGKLKFGLSSPNYISDASNFSATLDGRRNNEPFNVHISSEYSFDQTISFASKLKYDKHSFNGNVIDFMLTPDYIENNLESFVDYLFATINEGFFQMQMNVISSKQLIEAKKNPALYPNLIVRVWGFSAYFNDLPNDYKELLIKRALQNEQ